MLLHRLTLAALFLSVATPVSAAGINAYWNNCSAGAGSSVRSFACNTNAGTNDIVASFDPPAGLTKVNGAVGIIDLCLGGVNLAPWWQLGSGGCRQPALSALAQDVGLPEYCANYWQGQAAASVDYLVGYSGWDSARMVIWVAMDPAYSGPVDPGIEYHAFTVRIANTGTAGAGSCFGCQFFACIVINEIRLTQPSGTPGGDAVLANARDNNQLMWQGYTPGCPFIVPVTNRTWGQVKSLYR